MKILIWFGCFFIATILNTILGYATGVKVGYLIFYFGVYFVAKKLCNKWDEHKEAKTKNKNNTQTNDLFIDDETENTVEEQIMFCRKCGEKLIDSSKFCRKCGTEVKVEEQNG